MTTDSNAVATPHQPVLRSQIERNRWHPAAATAAVACTGYVVICLVFAGVGALLTHQLGAVTRWDAHVGRWFVDNRTTTLNHWTGYATTVADTLGISVVLAAAALVLLLLRHRWEALFLVLAIALELTTFLTINAVVGRPRPPGPRLGSLPSTSSFPSGHTAAMVALYGGLALLINARVRARLIGVLAYVVAFVATATVGVARVYRGMHHPTDVIVGALLGLAVLAVAMLAVRAGERAAASREGGAT